MEKPGGTTGKVSHRPWSTPKVKATNGAVVGERRALPGLQQGQRPLEAAWGASLASWGRRSLCSLTVKGGNHLSIGQEVASRVTPAKPNKGRWTTEKESPPRPCPHASTCGFRSPCPALLGKVSGYFSLNCSPAWTPAVPDVRVALSF